MSNYYFVREGIARPLRSTNGNVIHFDPIGDDTGILATNNVQIAGEIRSLITRQKFGLREVAGPDAFEALKKKANDGQRRLDSLLANSVPKPRIDRLDQPGRNAAAGSSPEFVDPTTNKSSIDSKAGHPLEVPSEIPLPPALSEAKKPQAKKGGKAAKA